MFTAQKKKFNLTKLVINSNQKTITYPQIKFVIKLNKHINLHIPYIYV